MLRPIILLIILIMLNAIFASAEIAVISMNASKLKSMASEGSAKAKKLLLLTEQPARFLATIQVAITLAGFLQSAFAAENFADPVVNWLVGMGVTISPSVLNSVSIIVITVILSYFNLVFGELIPKRVAMKKTESLALALANMLYAVSKIFAPLVWLLTLSTNAFLRIMGMNPDEDDEQVTEEEIRMMLLEGNEQGTIQEDENEIIQNVFEFNDTDIEEICTHRRDIVLLHMDDSDEVWAETIMENRYTFYPICEKETDDIIAILDSKDYFRIEDKSKGNLMKNAVKEPLFVPETMMANVLFRKMKEKHEYFAVILDEYGALSGIITLHDLVESLVGELVEEDDEDKGADIEKLEDGVWKIYGYAMLDDISEELGIDIHSDDHDTFNGYICDIIDRIPSDGERFECETDGLNVYVKSVENHMIGETLVRIKEKPADEDEEE